MKPALPSLPNARTLRRWHKKLGLVGAFFLLLVSLTGVLINHSHPLSLDSQTVNSGWLLDWYGIAGPSKVSQFAAQDLPLVATDNLLWHGQQRLLDADSPVQSAIVHGDKILAVDGHALYWLSIEGQLLEKQEARLGLPASPNVLGVTDDGRIWLQTPDGCYVSDDQLLAWQASAAPADIRWAWPQTIADRQPWINLARSTHLSWERLLLDLHSGRLLGAWAIWLWDLVALIFVLLSASGIWIYLKNGNGRS